MNFRRYIKNYTDAPITHQMLMEGLVEYRRPNDKISELIREDMLIALRRGLYLPGSETDLPLPDNFVIANSLRGPSYISLESALAHWGLIPERVYEITSVTLKSSRMFDTPIARFSYRHLKSPYYAFGIQRIEITAQQAALIASREKAVCDKIVLTSGINLRSVSQTLDFLIDDLRIDEHQLQQLNVNLIDTWLEDAPKSSSLQMLTKALRTL